MKGKRRVAENEQLFMNGVSLESKVANHGEQLRLKHRITTQCSSQVDDVGRRMPIIYQIRSKSSAVKKGWAQRVMKECCLQSNDIKYHQFEPSVNTDILAQGSLLRKLL